MAVCTGTGKSGQKVQAGFAPESDKRSWLSAEHVRSPPRGLSSSVSGQISEKRRLKPQSTWAPDLMRPHPHHVLLGSQGQFRFKGKPIDSVSCQELLQNMLVHLPQARKYGKLSPPFENNWAKLCFLNQKARLPGCRRTVLCPVAVSPKARQWALIKSYPESVFLGPG